jgi:hypothetical protein
MTTPEEFPDTPNIADMGPVHVVAIEKVTPSVGNPRKISDKAVSMVAKSITEFGWQQPIVVDKDYVVIAGHTRLKAANRMKLKRVPVTIAEHLTEKQIKAYRISDNRSGDFTSWDFPELTQQLEELADEFSDVLGLADWEAVVTEFNNLEEGGTSELEIDPDVADYMSEEFKLTVICDSEESARIVAASVIEMAGVTDVRDKR